MEAQSAYHIDGGTISILYRWRHNSFTWLLKEVMVMCNVCTADVTHVKKFVCSTPFHLGAPLRSANCIRGDQNKATCSINKTVCDHACTTTALRLPLNMCPPVTGFLGSLMRALISSKNTWGTVWCMWCTQPRGCAPRHRTLSRATSFGAHHQGLSNLGCQDRHLAHAMRVPLRPLG